MTVEMTKLIERAPAASANSAYPGIGLFIDGEWIYNRASVTRMMTLTASVQVGKQVTESPPCR